MLTNLPQYIAYVRKALIQVIGFLSGVLALGLLPAKYAVLATTIIGVLATITHYKVGNGEAPGTAPAVEEFTPDDDEATDDSWKPAKIVTSTHAKDNPQPANPPDQV